MSENEVVEWINESGGHGENTLDYLDTIIEEHPNINYLGRVEGQPGGGGAPPKNKY